MRDLDHTPKGEAHKDNEAGRSAAILTRSDLRTMPDNPVNHASWFETMQIGTCHSIRYMPSAAPRTFAGGCPLCDLRLESGLENFIEQTGKTARPWQLGAMNLSL